MKKIGELRQRAASYRRLKRQITDDRAVKALNELADETEMTAELEKRQLIRERAHQIWIERGRPEGAMWSSGSLPSGSWLKANWLVRLLRLPSRLLSFSSSIDRIGRTPRDTARRDTNPVSFGLVLGT